MSWSTTLNYPGHLTDIVGQIVGPNVHKEYYVITDVEHRTTHRNIDADLRADSEKYTVAKLELLTDEGRKSLSKESQHTFTLTRRASFLQEAGIDVMQFQLPPAFRQPMQMGVPA